MVVMNRLDFSEALRRIKLGAKIHRLQWEPGHWIQLSDNEDSIISVWGTGLEIIYLKEPRIFSSEELLAEDWIDSAE